MFLMLLTGCLGTYAPATTEVGPYAMALPTGTAPVDLGMEQRKRLFVADFRSADGAPYQEVLVSRPTAVSKEWSDGGLPQIATSQREALSEVRYEPTEWMGGSASLGAVVGEDGVPRFMWAAIRDGWLHELQCAASDEAGGAQTCQAVANSFRLTTTLPPMEELPSDYRPERAGPLVVPVPAGWSLGPTDPSTPEQVLRAAPPLPDDPRAPRSIGSLVVEVDPKVALLGHWVEALVHHYWDRGLDLINQTPFDGTYGRAFLCEYTDGVSITFTLDTISPAGMIHAECDGSLARRTELRVMCSDIFKDIVLAEPLPVEP